MRKQMRNEHGKRKPPVTVKHDARTAAPSYDRELPTDNVNMSVLKAVVTS